jgi:hypothetical protein
MTSSPRAGAALAAAAAAASVIGCSGAHDLGFTGGSLLVLKGHVDLTALQRPNPDPAPQAALLGALVWAQPAAPDPVCIEFGTVPPIASACPNPYGVFNGQLETFAPVDGNGDFSLTITHLPDPSVSVGDASTRIAYGSLMVVEDVDGDGQPTLLAAQGGGDGFDAPGAEPPPSSIDRILAATFYDLNAPQVRVAFREGGFIDGCPNDQIAHTGCSYFYPLVGCEPPSGFSIVTAPPYSDTTGVCSTSGTADTIEIPTLAPSDGTAFLCRAVQVSGGVRSPRNEAPRGGASPVCVSPNIMAAMYHGFCPWFRSYALKGCMQDPLCASPEWDQTASPPPWWPCF